VTLWTAINPGVVGLSPADLTEFNGNLWFQGQAAAQGGQLYKLGFEVTKWTAINPGGAA